ncbi:hypothetical protein NQ317_004587 [Molorchus minor]|uniref:C2H2-type domain-containing protein n=1 Tax=Molorchus minor TaxID=1323400 RepID=A0ABQ9JYI5_9CUCU|nr:hypothetical protein NQ317_004587 [Molorchus minor]
MADVCSTAPVGRGDFGADGTFIIRTISTTTADDKKPGSTSDLVKTSMKRSRPKPTSPNRQGPQQCLVCAKVFGNASALAKHKLTHSDERKYVCSMCGKAFKRQDHL